MRGFTPRGVIVGAALTVMVFAAQRSSAAPRLLITEAMPDPSGTDADREWIEMYNADTVAVNLTGYSIGDGTTSGGTSTGEGMGVFPDGTVMQPGQVYLIAVRAGGFNPWIQATFPNAKADFEFANPGASTIADDPNTPKLTQRANWSTATNPTLAMANGGDDVAILDPDGNVIDWVSYGTNTNAPAQVSTWVDAASASIQRIGPGNTSADWQYVTGLSNATPGTVSANVVPEPATASLLAAAGGLALLRRRRRRA